MTGRTVGTIKHVRGRRDGDQVTTAWAITADPDVVIRIKRILPSIQTTRAETLYVSDTDQLCRELEWITSRWNFGMSDDDRQYLHERADDDEEREQLVANIIAGTATVTSTALALWSPVASVSGVATVSATGSAAYAPIGSVSGSAAVTAVASASYSAVATVSGVATLTGSGTTGDFYPATASITGTSSGLDSALFIVRLQRVQVVLGHFRPILGLHVFLPAAIKIALVVFAHDARSNITR